jgi:hypothetical protein
VKTEKQSLFALLGRARAFEIAELIAVAGPDAFDDTPGLRVGLEIVLRKHVAELGDDARAEALGDAARGFLEAAVEIHDQVAGASTATSSEGSQR